MGLKSLDWIMEQLKDARWHSIDDIKKVIALPPEKTNLLIDFLKESNFIYKKDEKLKITNSGLKFLQLEA